MYNRFQQGGFVYCITISHQTSGSDRVARPRKSATAETSKSGFGGGRGRRGRAEASSCGGLPNTAAVAKTHRVRGRETLFIAFRPRPELN